MYDPTLWTWKKSKRSGGSNDCVEVAINPTIIGIRDSKDRSGKYITVQPKTWRRFLATPFKKIESISQIGISDKTSIEREINPAKAEWCRMELDGLRDGLDYAFVPRSRKETYVALRHSVRVEPILVFTSSEWSAFLDGVVSGEFDVPIESTTSRVGANRPNV